MNFNSEHANCCLDSQIDLLYFCHFSDLVDFILPPDLKPIENLWAEEETCGLWTICTDCAQKKVEDESAR
ncbi:hypothetical protein AMECASPLE_004483 [Ameca splendens]|uniref:Uncharacterized protein n=1 Tax=Ameca splendens TaxID=208324 RepID=A0ABV0XMU6_9TELE